MDKMFQGGKTMKSKRIQRKKGRSRSRRSRRSRKVGGANVNIDEALQYLADHFPGAKAKALELGEDVKYVAADMLLNHLLIENMDGPDKTPDWTGPINPATGQRVRKGDKFRYYALFVKGNTASASKMHLYARLKDAYGSKGEHLISSSLNALERY